MSMSFHRVLGNVALAALLAAGSARPLLAESFALEPITLDVQSDSGDLVLVAAYSAETSSPQLVSYGGGAARTALRTPDGRLQPSIILGLIAPGQEEDFGIEGLLQDTIEANGFGYQDLEARDALRISDPDLFRKLVEGGHIDPPEDQLKFALQEELKRMNCYRSRIDGDWGRGSRRSVANYFAALDNGSSWPPNDPPSNDLFRAILINGDATCQVAAAAAPTSRTTTTRPAAPTPQAPAPATSTNALPRGVFR